MTTDIAQQIAGFLKGGQKNADELFRGKLVEAFEQFLARTGQRADVMKLIGVINADLEANLQRLPDEPLRELMRGLLASYK